MRDPTTFLGMQLGKPQQLQAWNSTILVLCLVNHNEDNNRPALSERDFLFADLLFGKGRALTDAHFRRVGTEHG